MSHWPKLQPEDYEDYETYFEQLELWKEHEERLMEDYL